MDKLKNQILVLLGTQGSGKGTHSELLSKKFNIPQVIAGDLFREKAKENSLIGKRIKARLDRGKLMTIDLWEKTISSYLQKHNFKEGVIFDSLLRSMAQVKRFDAIKKKKDLPDPWIIFISLSEDEAVKRLLKRNREDDTPENIRSRQAWSRSKMMPVINYYRKKNRVLEINGDQSIKEVHKDILKALKNKGIL